MPTRKPNREKNRLKNVRVRKPSLLPKRFKRPSDPEQARKWLREVADHLSNFPNAGPGYRFVAYAIKKFLHAPGKMRLGDALGLKPRIDSKRGRPPVPAKTIRAISKMLTLKVDVQKIVEVVDRSKSFVESIRADYRAVTWEAPLSKIDIGDELRQISPEFQAAEARERQVPKVRRDAIILGISDAIPLSEIIPNE